MAKGKHSTALFEVMNRPARTGVAPPTVITRAPHNVTQQPNNAVNPAPHAPLSGVAEPGKAVELDRDRHQISLRVSYTSALVTLFAVVVVVVLAYLMGRGVERAPEVAAETSTQTLQNGPAMPEVANVSTPSGMTSPPGAAAARTPNPAAERPNSAASTASLIASGPIAAPTTVRRIVGQNYVIMQSYPEEAQAKEAQALLLAAGIPCTVERGPSGWVPMSWYSVIGTHGFDRVTKNPQLDAYVNAIERVNANQPSKFKKLDPRAYRWK